MKHFILISSPLNVNNLRSIYSYLTGIINVALVLSITELTSCIEKDIPKGQLIQASGFVVDSIKNKKLSGVVVYLYGGEKSYYGGVYYVNGPLDSTVSDKNGNFYLRYTAEGNSIDYALAIGNVIYGGYTSQDNFVIDIDHRLYPFDYSYQLKNIELRARELNYAKVSLKILSNPYDSLYLSIRSTYGELRLLNMLFIGKTVDTTFLTRYLPGETNYFDYRILSSGLFDSTSNFIRREIDTLKPILKDTISISKTIKSTYSIPLEVY